MSASMGMLLEKYTPEQIAEIIDAVMTMRPVAVQPVTTHSAAAAAAATAISVRKKRSKKTTVSKTAQRSAAVSSRPFSSIAPSRPLNSWMAFRSYHAPMFKTFQQKEISGLLTRLWQNDPFKAKWSLLAKAYSMIREYKTKDVAPLDVFLSLTCPYIGIIPRDDYLSVMGWEIVGENGEKMMERRFTPDISSFQENILTTNLSSEEIVSYCYQVSYIQNDNGDITRSRGAAATLTMAAQPASSSTQLRRSVLTTAPLDSFITKTEEPEAQEDTALVAKLQAALNENNDNAAGASATLRQTVHDLSGQQYPYNDEFDPYAAQPLSYDPFVEDQDSAFSNDSLGTYLAPGETTFPDTFNINDFLNNDFFEMSK
ncbi:hypothetical protein MBLNU459_g4008t1 [Dothideomycetes sp. NU459]